MTHRTDVTDPILLERFLTLVLFSTDLPFLVSLAQPTSERRVSGQTRKDGGVEDEGCTIRDEADNIESHGGAPAISSYGKSISG